MDLSTAKAVLDLLGRVSASDPLDRIVQQALREIRTSRRVVVRDHQSPYLLASHYFDIYRVRLDHLRDAGRADEYPGLEVTVSMLSSVQDQIRLVEVDCGQKTILLFFAVPTHCLVGCIFVRDGKTGRDSFL